MIHAGILGAGNISETHARAASETEGLEIVAVHGHNREKAERLASLYGGKVYADLDSFLAHRPLDLVLIGSPSGLHAEQGIAAARRGLHVLVEKPVDITTERADALTEACERAGVKLGVFFQDRAAPDVRRLKEFVEAGGLGRPLLVSGRLRWYRPPEYYRDSRWRGTWALDGGGALMNQGVHTLDLLLWLLGDVRRVYAKAVTALHEIEVEDTAVATLEFESGAVGTLEATTAAFPGYPRRVELTGTEGTVILEQNRIVAADLRTPREGLVSPPEASAGNPSASSPVVSDVSGHREILADFLRAVETGARPICDGREGRRSVALAQAVYESSRTGRAVTPA
ncbi:MAG TPA: Gfo/Idh/MocA family oxidoreductase [Pyrinomonadaceae bacterium]|nr:Gfo/Idh/MocA family oxidoreductase [Pyrinomonadaceae bacterium]